MPKFFIEEGNLHENHAKIQGSDVNHITKVLRLTPKSIIIVCDGLGNDYKAQIVRSDKDFIHLEILEKMLCKAEPNLKVTLFQGVPKSGKMEYIIEKCTELGIHRIVPVMTKRTVVKIEDKKAEEKKLQRWRKTASESVKQCGRGAIPEISKICEFQNLKKYIDNMDLCIVAYEKEKNNTLKEVLKSNKEISTVGIIVGPEGGFEEEEITYLKSLGVHCVTLGERILRTETAGHTVLSAIMYEFDEI